MGDSGRLATSELVWQWRETGELRQPFSADLSRHAPSPGRRGLSFNRSEQGDLSSIHADRKRRQLPVPTEDSHTPALFPVAALSTSETRASRVPYGHPGHFPSTLYHSDPLRQSVWHTILPMAPFPSQQGILELAEFCLTARLCSGHQEPVWNEIGVSSQEHWRKKE